MYKGLFVTEWTIDRTYDIERLRQAGDSFSDATGQLAENIVPYPPLLAVYGEVNNATIDRIRNDSKHGEASMLWYEEIIDETP